MECRPNWCQTERCQEPFCRYLPAIGEFPPHVERHPEALPAARIEAAALAGPSVVTFSGPERRILVDGTLTGIADGTVQELHPGDANRHAEPARALIVPTPGTIGRRYFGELAAVVNLPGGPDPARLRKIMHRHGLVPA